MDTDKERLYNWLTTLVTAIMAGVAILLGVNI